jgi:tetratricopeptide (TPR) repeat protein
MTRRYVFSVILPLCFFVSFFVVCNQTIREIRSGLSTSYQLNVSPLSPALFKLVAGEFKGLLADYLVLEVGSVIGVEKKIPQEEYEKSAAALAQSLALDPYFQQTYLYAQAIVAMEGEMPRKAIPLLDVSREQRFWDWRPAYYMGFDYYYFLGDYAKASDMFFDAAKVKHAPSALAVLGGRFAKKGGRIEAAIGLLQSMLEDPGLDEKHKAQLSDRLVALQGVLLLENSIREYGNHYGSFPPSLETLIEKGLLREMPPNPYADRFYYEEKDGQVFFDDIR